MPTEPLVVVTATTNRDRAEDCVSSWGAVPVIYVDNGQDGVYLGSVEAFRRGVDAALASFPDAGIIACLHDDLQIHDPDWAARVVEYFAENPAMGLAGFGGAIALGDADLYQKEYAPQALARKGFRSNLVDAEAHGIRRLYAERVACLDGFSQIGRRAFWEGRDYETQSGPAADVASLRPWEVLRDLGMVHHFYDSALGCLAARAGWETWYLPIPCVHYGGRTAVGDRGYQQWALAQPQGGDHGFWREAHRIGYDAFRDVLPLSV